MRSTKAYKLFRVRKDGSLGPLFIGASQRIQLGEWLEAEDIPTKGYAHRPGWHSGALPDAPHLSERGRVWVECEIKEFYKFIRPKNQGGYWWISKWLKANRILTDEEVVALRST